MHYGSYFMSLVNISSKVVLQSELRQYIVYKKDMWYGCNKKTIFYDSRYAIENHGPDNKQKVTVLIRNSNFINSL